MTIVCFVLAFGAIAFSFGGTATFPTIQTDMKHPNLFHIAVVFAYLCVLALYIPVSTLGYFAFGDNIQSNVLKNLGSSSPITKAVEALITAHLLFSFVIVINPVSQQLEEWLSVSAGRKNTHCLCSAYIVALGLFFTRLLVVFLFRRVKCAHKMVESRFTFHAIHLYS